MRTHIWEHSVRVVVHAVRQFVRAESQPGRHWSQARWHAARDPMKSGAASHPRWQAAVSPQAVRQLFRVVSHALRQVVSVVAQAFVHVVVQFAQVVLALSHALTQAEAAGHAVQAPMTHMLPAAHEPQRNVPPQPSGTSPQRAPAAVQSRGTQVMPWSSGIPASATPASGALASPSPASPAPASGALHTPGTPSPPQMLPVAQVPHEPPQPSSPHARPLHAGVHPQTVA